MTLITIVQMYCFFGKKHAYVINKTKLNRRQLKLDKFAFKKGNLNDIGITVFIKIQLKNITMRQSFRITI